MVLEEILRARHPLRPAGHWVVMKTRISGVDLFAMVYAWSQKGFSCMVSSCGKTVRHSEDYRSKYSDEYDNKCTHDYARPAVAHQLYHFLPLIDEFNKERQKTLALEKKWPTRNCWRRCVTSIIGQCVVDVMRWDRAKRAPVPICYTDNFTDFDIRGMANAIARPVYAGGLGARDNRRVGLLSVGARREDNQPITRIRGDDGTIVYPTSDGRNSRGRTMRCFICRRHRRMPKNTTWMCRCCGMPLCKINRGRGETCVEEHQRSTHPVLGCGMVTRTRNQFIMPDDLKLYRITRK